MTCGDIFGNRRLAVSRIDNPADYYDQSPDPLNEIGASAFSQEVSGFGAQVAERFHDADFCQIFSIDEVPVGFGLYKKLSTQAGLLLSIEGRAISREFQGKGLGSTALRELLLSEPEAIAAASCTRNPAIPRLMSRYFTTVSPDIKDTNPLHFYNDNEIIRYLTAVYGEHVNASPADLPFTYGRYTGGLYGADDPGAAFPGLPELQISPENGMIMVATGRRI